MAAASYPEFHVTGAVHHYIRVPGNSNIYYLGTAEVTPKIQLKQFWGEVFNSIGGNQVPMQRTEQGEMATVGVMFNRFSKLAVDALQKMGPSIRAGWRNRYSRGHLAFGNTSFELWQVYENSLDPGYASTGLEPGRYWPLVVRAEDNSDSLTTDAEKLLLVWDAIPLWIPQTSPSQVSGYERSWKLYSTDASDFPAAVKVPQ